MSLLVGDVVRLTATFRVGSTNTDPTTVSCTVKTPSGVTTVHTFGSSAIVHSATGAYYLDQACSEDGTWRVLWTGTGAAPAVEVKTFTVGPTGF